MMMRSFQTIVVSPKSFPKSFIMPRPFMSIVHDDGVIFGI